LYIFKKYTLKQRKLKSVEKPIQNIRLCKDFEDATIFRIKIT